MGSRGDTGVTDGQAERRCVQETRPSRMNHVEMHMIKIQAWQE